MPAASAFPPIDLSAVTDRPLVEMLKKDPETPEFNAILRRKRREVSQLRNAKWPAVRAVEPEAREGDEPPPKGIP